jgi:uncharacterized protein (TIGR00251 family)
MWCTQHGRGVRLAVHVMPNAKQSAVAEVHGDALKIRLQAPPVEGKANAALVGFIAGVMNVPKSAVAVTHGATSRRKLVTVDGVVAAEVEARLLELIAQKHPVP